MSTPPTRGRVRAAILALCSMAAIAVAALAAFDPAVAAGRPQHQAGPAAAGVPVVINCTGQAQTRPGQYVLACADGNAYLKGLHWAAWGPASAFAAGTSTFKVCIPSCAAGHVHSFPMLAALWRAEPLPAHPGLRYFTRLTIIYTGNRSYRVGGTTYHLHLTVTYPLSAFGGA